jgi:hypothetical protein
MDGNCNIELSKFERACEEWLYPLLFLCEFTFFNAIERWGKDEWIFVWMMIGVFAYVIWATATDRKDHWTAKYAMLYLVLVMTGPFAIPWLYARYRRWKKA